MSLKEFIEGRHLELDLNVEHYHDMLGSKTRFTRMTNRPATATLPEVLHTADRLDVHPVRLYDDYQMGRLMLTEEDVSLLRRRYRAAPLIHCSPTQHHVIPNPTP